MKPGIGFHELRQACEISVLREDLERLVQETAGLRDSVEEAVEQVRTRFAALGAEELSDATVMAELLQFAVTTLLDIREQARRISLQTGPVADDDRPSWVGAAEAPRLRPVPAQPSAPAPRPATTESAGRPALPPSVSMPPPPMEPVPEPSAPPASPVVRPATRPAKPEMPIASSLLMREPAAPQAASYTPPPTADHPSASAAWLTSTAPPPPPSRAAAVRANQTSSPAPGGIDWLGPAGR